jgi:hypothetical protein
LQQNYSANIAEPTSVNTLISELIEQAALVVWWEPLTQLIRLQVLRAIATNASTFGEDNTLEGSLTISEQPTTRISQVFTYFGQRNPLDPIDQENNFRSAVLTIDGDAELDYGTSAIKKIYSRWIPFGARTVATRLNDLLLGRFRNPPRRFTLALFRHSTENPMLGGGYRVAGWPIQNIDGTASDAPIQITRLNPLSDRYEIEAEEMLFETQDPADLTNRVIVIDADINNINIRDIHDNIYPDPVVGSPSENLTVIIETNVIVGSIDSNQVAMTMGDWPVGYPITVIVYGRIQGAGGDGGTGATPGGSPMAGEAGGTALYTRAQITLILNQGDGEIWGGGGGGGGGDDQIDNFSLTSGQSGGGGGGAGTIAGDGAERGGIAGTSEAGGLGGGGEIPGKFEGGDGGDPGQAGDNGTGNNPGIGGAAGIAIDGSFYVTKIGTGDVRGPEVN